MSANVEELATGGPALSPRGPLSWPVCGLLNLISGFVCVMPAPIAYGFGVPLAVLIYLVALWREPKLNRRNRGALRNMRIVFGRDPSPPPLRKLLWRYALHMAALTIEVLRLPLLTKRRFRKLVDVSEGEGVLRELLAEGKGVIVATGHFGNWEVLSATGALLGLPVTALNRPCDEAGLQRWLHARRSSSGQKVLSKYGGLWPLKKVLNRGGLAGLNMDENTRKGGLFTPFCGVLAASSQTAAQLQRLTKAPIVILTCQRTDLARFRFCVWRVIRRDPSVAKDAEQLRVTTQIMETFEEVLRTHPDQWMWSLRRWETRPEGEVMGADGLPPRVNRRD